MRLSSAMIGWRGLISITFCDAMYCDRDGSEKAWLRMMRSMLAELPYWLVTRMHGVVSTRGDTVTLEILDS